MDVTITIGDPVLLPGEKFTVRYRPAGGAWISLGDQTNAPFTIPGLTEGEYEYEVTFVTVDGVECPPVYGFFTVPPPAVDPPADACLCPTIDVLYVQKNCGNGAVIHVEFDELGNAICNYEITYTEFGGVNPQTISYAVLPQILEIPIPYNGFGDAPTFALSIQCCSSQNLNCFPVMKILDVRDCECETPPHITSAVIGYNNTTGEYSVTVQFTPSVGNQVPYLIEIQQINTISTVPGISQSVASAGTYSYVVPVGAYGGQLMFNITVSNQCGTDGILSFTDCPAPVITSLICTPIASPVNGHQMSITFTDAPGNGPYVIYYKSLTAPDEQTLNVAVPGTYSLNVFGGNCPGCTKFIIRVSNRCGFDERGGPGSVDCYES